jgi:Mce-associated membrane protein
MTAAARAAAKRTKHPERGGHDTRTVATVPAGSSAVETRKPAEEQPFGRTVVIEAPDGWDDPPEPAEEALEESRPVQRPRRGPRAAALCLVLAAALVAVAVLGWQYREGRQADRAGGQALTAARKAAPVVLSYDYRHLDRDFARARTHLTGHFRDEYQKTTRTVVAPAARKYHGVVKATVAAPASGGAPAASVVSSSPEKVIVLLFVNQVTRSTQVTGSRVDLNRVRMTLTRTSKGWKVSAVDAL